MAKVPCAGAKPNKKGKEMDRINRISCVPQADGSIDIVIPAGAVEEFKLMVRKATNCWPDQSVEMRDFVDRLMSRDKFVGSCMKTEIYGHTKHGETVEVITTSAENHIADIHEAIRLENQTYLARRSCCDTLLREPHMSQCSQVTGICNGHPETCNCPKHCR